MKFTVLLFMLFFGLSVTARADIYQWVDNKGVVNFTDNPDAVPKKYQNKVKVLPSDDSSQEGTPPETEQPSVQAAPPQQPVEQPPQQKIFGGHDETWWRSQYGGLRGELAQLQANLPAKRAELDQLRRKLVIYTFTRNRIAYQQKLAEVQNDEARINTLTDQLAALDTQAASAGVPFAWRQ
jgi:hypothetical protein